MRECAIGLLAAVVGVAGVSGSAAEQAAAKGGGQYQAVKVCSLLPLAEVRKIAPWEPAFDKFAKAEEHPLGSSGSSCEYPTAGVQVMAFNPATLDSLKKARKVEPVAGVGDEAYVANNADTFGELYARVGPHFLTIQMTLGTNGNYASVKPKLVQLDQAVAAKLR